VFDEMGTEKDFEEFFQYFVSAWVFGIARVAPLLYSSSEDLIEVFGSLADQGWGCVRSEPA
jgi:hypothetical protein